MTNTRSTLGAGIGLGMDSRGRKIVLSQIADGLTLKGSNGWSFNRHFIQFCDGALI
jgi:hypothetical protein